MKQCPFCKSTNVKDIFEIFSKEDFEKYVGSPLYLDDVIASAAEAGSIFKEKVYFCKDSERVFTTYCKKNQIQHLTELIKIDNDVIEVFKDIVNRENEEFSHIRKFIFNQYSWDYIKIIQEDINVGDLLDKINGHLPIETLNMLINFS